MGNKQALIQYQPQGESTEIITSLDDAVRLGEIVARSGMFKDVQDASKAVIKMLAGRDLGIPPIAALRGIHVFQGKVEIGAGLLAAKIKAGGKYNYRVRHSDDQKCEIEWFENGEPCGVSSFTIEEAKRANLTGKDNWKNFASDMLFARALTRGQRRYAPDAALGSVYAPGEIGDLSAVENAPVYENVIEAEAEPAPEMVTDAQLTELHRIFTGLESSGVTLEKLREGMKTLTGVDELGELTNEAAAKVIASFSKKLESRQAQAERKAA